MANMNFEMLLFNAIKNGQESVRSVYDIWLDLGNVGTPQDFIDSLKGQGATIVNGVTVEADSWVLYDGIYKTTINDEKITSNDVVNINFTNDSISNAINSGILGYTNTINGAFEIYSNFLPTVDLTIDYSIISN